MATALDKDENGRSRKAGLDDRYEERSGAILINGVQALVRLMLVQADADEAAGLKTGGFVSGYRGSPLGGLDTAFARADKQVGERGIVVRPAVNEELAATAVAGSQQIERSPGAAVEGVFSLWYGKGPGLDRASDAIRHGVQQGASPKGGVVLAIGDDHVAKSSSIVCNSDDVAAGLQVPLFYPADVGEIVEFGLHGFALSRHTGSWTALKIITEVADSTRTVSGAELPFNPVLPPAPVPASGLYNRWPETPLEQEDRHVNYRLPAIAAYVRANGLDRIVLKEPGAHIGLVAAGKSWMDLREGLRLLGLDDAKLAELGVALYKPAMIWPLEPEGMRDFASGLGTLIVVEEKGALIEDQAKALLYNCDDAPAIWGKRDARGHVLTPATGDLTPERIAGALGPALASLTGDPALPPCGDAARARLAVQDEYATPPVLRKPFFCSGCPHNRSTTVPEGSRAMAGIGCHGLAAYNRPETGTFAQMGGEGVHWVGLAPFTEEKHVFANMGDGTYFHSGLLAIRQAVAARVNITYKLLYNAAVAMTGGQSVDGELSVLQIVDQLRAEGVSQVVICADDPERYPAGHAAHAKVERIVHRDDLDALQRDLRAAPGVSVIVYDQMCATEKRRLRKRGKMETPPERVFINTLVCEGCGDCSIKSNCLSVEPEATPFGVKRKVNQSSCNMDYSCLNGFCPSFVTVAGGKPKRDLRAALALDAAALPAPPKGAARHQRIIVSGIGGAGIVTIGALAAMAAHVSGRRAGVLDQIGMAQKGGAVVSHVHIADEPITALRVPAGEADLVIACDQVVANMRDVIAAIDSERTHVIANDDVAITGEFTQDRAATPDGAFLARRLRKQAGEGMVASHPFTRIAEKLFGDAIGANLMMLGFSWQKGWLDLDEDAFETALTLNGVAVEMNKAAFAWGRRLAADPAAVYEACGFGDQREETVDEIIARRTAFLTAYQNAAYAERFAAKIGAVLAAENRNGGDGRLAGAAARSLFRLMAYKDEYEVARLFTDGAFAQALGDAFEGDVKLAYHMAPPFLSRRDRVTGHLRKRRFGAWLTPLLGLLAKGRVLRGTFADPFGHSRERREERRMIEDYEALLDRLVAALRPDNLAQAVELASLVQEVRGFGHVKDEAAARYREALPGALETFEGVQQAATESAPAA